MCVGVCVRGHWSNKVLVFTVWLIELSRDEKTMRSVVILRYTVREGWVLGVTGRKMF